jgi:exonuclease III
MTITWRSGENSSRIDYIFASEDIMEKIRSHEIIDVKDFDTDHKALTITFDIEEKIKNNK